MFVASGRLILNTCSRPPTKIETREKVLLTSALITQVVLAAIGTALFFHVGIVSAASLWGAAAAIEPLLAGVLLYICKHRAPPVVEADGSRCAPFDPTERIESIQIELTAFHESVQRAGPINATARIIEMIETASETAAIPADTFFRVNKIFSS